MTVKIELDDSLYTAAAQLAERRGLKTKNNPGVTAVIRTALSAYLSKYAGELAHKRPTMGAKIVLAEKLHESVESSSYGLSG